MNVLFITGWYPTDYNANFGIFVKEHARSVAQAGANVKVLHIWPVKSNSLWKVNKEWSTDEYGIESCQVLVHSLFHKVIYHLWPLLYLQAYQVIEDEILPQFKPDFLHGHVVYPAGFITQKLSDDLNIPYFLTEHWTKIDWIFRHPLWYRRASRVYQQAQKVFPVSSFLAKQIQQHTGEETRISVVPNIVDEMFHFEPVEKEDEKVELLCIMNFFLKEPKHKIPELVAFALARLPEEKQQKIRIRYIGPGQEGSVIKKKIEQLHLQAEVIYEGLCTKAYIARGMRKADYLVHPTTKETFGVVIAEALCSGLPCIISNNDTLKELVDTTNGYVVPENTPGAWAEALEKILEDKLKFNREEIAQKVGGTFSPEHVGNQYLQEYEKH